MIGRYLLTLTPEQESRVLTEKLAQAGFWIRDDGCRCLVGVVENIRTLEDKMRIVMAELRRCFTPGIYDSPVAVGIRFDDLSERFGEERINRAIRNRILANQARRVLTGVRETISA